MFISFFFFFVSVILRLGVCNSVCDGVVCVVCLCVFVGGVVRVFV